MIKKFDPFESLFNKKNIIKISNYLKSIYLLYVIHFQAESGIFSEYQTKILHSCV